MINLDTLLEANKLLLSDLERRAEAVAERQAKARRTLAECESETRQIEEERRNVLAVDTMYRRRFFPDDDAPSDALGHPSVAPELGKAKRARVGKQRYRMLVYLRDHATEWHSQNEIASITDLTQKRVRDQMRADIRDGVVAERDDLFQITPRGVALLGRFESYRNSKGEALPSLTGPVDDEDDDESAGPGQEEEDEIAE